MQSFGLAKSYLEFCPCTLLAVNRPLKKCVKKFPCYDSNFLWEIIYSFQFIFVITDQDAFLREIELFDDLF